MKVISGFNGLLKEYTELPDIDWIYVEPYFDLKLKKDDIKIGNCFWQVMKARKYILKIIMVPFYRLLFLKLSFKYA